MVSGAEVFYGAEGKPRRDFGDCLTEFFLEELFYPIGIKARHIYLIGSVIDGSTLPSENDWADNAEIKPDERVVFWGCGLRQPDGLTPAELRRMQVLSVRGPLSAAALKLDVASVPQGDPALLLPALYAPSPAPHAFGKSVCIPHFLDDRSDAELLNMSGCDIVLRTNMVAGVQDVRRFVDTIVAADFVLSASLHGATIAASYLRPFGFWDDGRIDTPFKWQDFAASVNIPARFHQHCDKAKSHYETVIKNRLSIPSLLPSLSVAPLLLRPNALLKVINYELAHLQPRKAVAALNQLVLKFDSQRHHYDRTVDGLIESLTAAFSKAENTTDEMCAVQATNAGAAQEREAAMAWTAAQAWRHEAALAVAAANKARSQATEARIALEKAGVRYSQAQYTIQAMYHSASWRFTRPLRVAGYLSRRQLGRALLEIGIPLHRVERLAARLGYHAPSIEPANLSIEPLRRDTAALSFSGPEDRLPARAQKAYVKLKANAAHASALSSYSGLAHGKQKADIDKPRRPRLALVSPLPPEMTGIADYTGELLPELEKHYIVDVIVDRESATRRLHQGRYPIRSAQWLRDNYRNLDCVLYHIGNSPFHVEMLDLLEEVPGVVVLHDFFLSHLAASAKTAHYAPNRLLQNLYESHGYTAVSDYYEAPDINEILFKYPANYSVLENALGVIVHSQSSRELARIWYDEHSADKWRVIPHLRKLPENPDRAEARARLGLNTDDFVVCSFGDIGPAKLNHRLLDSWINSAVSQNAQCVLIFVGHANKGDYFADLQKILQLRGHDKNIRFTGRVDSQTYKQYLAAADIGVQLRALSRGETSGTVLDCLSHAMATIVNANGAMAELDPDAVWMLANDFQDEQLIEALTALWQDQALRTKIGNKGRELIAKKHDPDHCAHQFKNAMDLFYQNAPNQVDPVDAYVLRSQLWNLTDEVCRAHALRLAPFLAGDPPARRIFLDITATARSDLKTGVERAARAITLSLLKSPPAGYRIEPVYLTDLGGEWHYRCAIKYALGLLDHPSDRWSDDLMIPHTGDILIILDISGDVFISAAAAGLFDRLGTAGLCTYATVYDLLPVHMPEFFPDGAKTRHARWLEGIRGLDGAICISKSVAIALQAWFENKPSSEVKPFKIGWSHLGADVESSAPSYGLPDKSAQTLMQLDRRPTFLMVGTIEPRKGYLQVIEAFSELWEQGSDINLVIVGKEGWRDISQNLRRTIPEIVGRLKGHAELERRLFWLEGITDEYLESIYAAANCMIIASEDEGFGLPIVEAARHNLPIIARDIDVFREIAGDHAYYFSGLKPSDLASAVADWLLRYEAKDHPKSGEIPWLTWKQSTNRLLEIILRDDFQFHLSA